MHHQKPQPPKPAPQSTVAALRQRAASDMRSAVLLSLIVCPQGGAGDRRHGQGKVRAAA